VVVEMSQFQLNHMNHRRLKCAKDNLRYPPFDFVPAAIAEDKQRIRHGGESHFLLNQAQ
jgi:hypothetical protein